MICTLNYEECIIPNVLFSYELILTVSFTVIAEQCALDLFLQISLIQRVSYNARKSYD